MCLSLELAGPEFRHMRPTPVREVSGGRPWDLHTWEVGNSGIQHMRNVHATLGSKYRPSSLKRHAEPRKNICCLNFIALHVYAMKKGPTLFQYPPDDISQHQNLDLRPSNSLVDSLNKIAAYSGAHHASLRNRSFCHSDIAFQILVEKFFARDIRFITVEQSRNFFQGGTFGLNEIEVDDDNLADQDGNVDEVEPPGQVLETDGVHCGRKVVSNRPKKSKELNENLKKERFPDRIG